MSSGGPRRSGSGRGGGRGSSTARGNAGAGRGGATATGGDAHNGHNRGGGRNSRRGPGRQKNRGGHEEGGGTSATNVPLRDEDVLIAFMPFLKGNDVAAARIYEEYQAGNDQRAFLTAARSFLVDRHSHQPLNNPVMRNDSSLTPVRAAPPSPAIPGTDTTVKSADNTVQQSDPQASNGQLQTATPNRPISHHSHGTPTTQQINDRTTSPSVENGVDALRLSENDPIVEMAFPSSTNGGGSIWGSGSPSAITPPRPTGPYISAVSASPWENDAAVTTPEPTNLHQPILSEEASPLELAVSPTPITPATAKREAPQPKRLWTHFEEQPGRITVNGVTGEDHSLVLQFGPRDELSAMWSMPMDHLMDAKGDLNPKGTALDRSLKGLTVGLFRRGCTENGPMASIISKDVSSHDYWFDPSSRTIRGKVPFFSPRTPGNVLFRMYWESNPIHTLAMGPTLRVRVLEPDFESSVRFILSNFKGRKSNPTSLSSLHSLAAVLETPLVRRHESAVARTVWGCVQESRKVVEACYQEYIKTCSKMAQLEEKLEEMKKQIEEDDTKSHDVSVDNGEVVHENLAEPTGAKSEGDNAVSEKTRALLGGRASCERKWRDCQLAFACIIKAILTNASMGSLLRRDLITRMRVEYELWCPLSEEFAVPLENMETWYQCVDELPQSITPDHFHTYQQARLKMQARTLGFDLNSSTLEDVLFPRNRNNPTNRSIDSGAVNVFNSMSGAMGQYYQDLFIDEDKVVLKRELIRQLTERRVQECGAFPIGTEVVIFGSSANGFGSPKSDLDMCLQLPPGTKLESEDGTGSAAMAKLAEHFEKTDMVGVDTARLTARIPIIMYKCPNPLSGGDSEVDLHECDLSMHNPLAVLNTSLLRTYAEITPVTRVLAAIIKRWAKARDINSPARHTLSSYGYIIMLLHFLTYHKRTGNGLVSTVAEPEGDSQVRNQTKPQATPILPNLQWMDPIWTTKPEGSHYRELGSRPKNIMKHPMKDNTVNSYFYKPISPNDKHVLQALFPGQDLSLSILLASFYRYYAYEFDYKRHVVSLHSTAARGVVEREVKAELDGWRNYSAALVIEDPFELDYDVAHVLRGGYYHRIRREFALAYTKIADAASGRPNSWNKGDLRSMSGKDLIDWICEPIVTDKDPA